MLQQIRHIALIFVLLMGVLSNGLAHVVVHDASKISIKKGAEGQCFLKAWEALANSNLDDAFRRNVDYVDNISKHSTSTGKSADEIVTIAKNNENGPEQFLDELENTPTSGHWDKDPIQRVRDIEDALGQNLPEPFKTIDRYDNGTITSIKSLDVNAKTYQTASKLKSRLKKYLDDLDIFTGHSQEGFLVGVQGGTPITSKTLEIAIPRAASGSQQAVLNEIIAYGLTKNINVVITIRPL
jgi:hypothetical protein